MNNMAFNLGARPAGSRGETIRADDGTRLYVEITGDGPDTILFCHEYAGDVRSWDCQVEALSGRYRCVTYSARGYHPSDIPEEPAAYSQTIAVADAIQILDVLEVDRVYVVGLSMGGYTTLNLLADHPERVIAALSAGTGFGSLASQRDGFVAECERFADTIKSQGMADIASMYAKGPSRLRLLDKDETVWEQFKNDLGQHSSVGSALVCLGVQRRRPTLEQLLPKLKDADKPLLILTGDEDEGCLEANLMLKRALPMSGWRVMENTGHTINIEEPERFSEAVIDFLSAVEDGRWIERRPETIDASFSGVTAK